MNKGKVEQDGTPIEVFEHPATAFVMDFLGNVNKLPVRVVGGKALLGETSQVEVPAKIFENAEQGRIDAYIRPHELDISRSADEGNCLLAKVVHVNPAGSIVKVRLLAEDFGLMITVDVSPERFKSLVLKPGDAVFVTPKAAKLFIPDYTI
jgi:sulfate transport system ATP-binding protein